MKRTLFRLLIALVVLTALGGGAWLGYGTVQRWRQGEERGVPTASVKRGNVSFPISAKGSISGGNSKMLLAPMTGSQQLTIMQLRKPGELVAEGEIVAQFDTTEETFKMREAEADLAEAEQLVAQSGFEAQAKEEELLAELIVARGEVEQAELEARRNPLLAAIVAQQNDLALKDAREKLAKLEKEYPERKAAARANVAIQEATRKKASVLADTAKKNIEKMTLKAPVGGYVSVESNTNSNFWFPGMTFPQYQVGDNIRPGMGVAQIPDFNSWEASVVITEADRGLLAVGQDAVVRIVALPKLALKAKVSNLGGTTGPPWERRFECKLTLSEKAAELRPGMSARVTISTETIKDVLWVPAQAVFESDSRKYVYAYENGSFAARDVKLIRRGESQVVVDGLREGTRVALASPDQKDASTKTSSGPTPGAKK
jgi:RND family efflux transporter MFP subunit